MRNRRSKLVCMARFRKRFVSERKAAFEIQQGVFLRKFAAKDLSFNDDTSLGDAVKVTWKIALMLR